MAVSQKIWTAGEKLATYVEMQGKIKSEDSELHKERRASKGLQVCKSDKIPSLCVTYRVPIAWLTFRDNYPHNRMIITIRLLFFQDTFPKVDLFFDSLV